MADTMKALFDFFIAHQDEFVENYNGKSIVLVDFKVVAAFDDDWEAAQYAMEKYPSGSFIVQRVTPGTEAYTLTIVSNLILADA